MLHPRSAARLRGEGSWLFGSNVGQLYSDNSAALHQYVRATRPDIAAYWVIDDDSADLATARSYGPTLSSNTVETYVRALLARVHIISHGAHDVPAFASQACNALRVRLGHGITATRIRKPSGVRAIEELNRTFDLVPVSSDFEKQNKIAWGIPEDRIVVTGVPRFDTLLAKQGKFRSSRDRILYMPTWRDGIANSISTFATSEYVRGISSLLNDEILADVLQRNDAHIHVVFHPIVRGFAQRLFKSTKGDRVSVEDVSDPQELFARVGALITDYSSVTWDFLYMDKPVIFYQFDQGAFRSDRGSYIDDQAGWPGPTAQTAVEVAELVDRLLSEDTPFSEAKQRIEFWKRKVFDFDDDKNCERVMIAIEEKLASKRG